jgi:hypothetical protein
MVAIISQSARAEPHSSGSTVPTVVAIAFAAIRIASISSPARGISPVVPYSFHVGLQRCK